MGNSSLLFEYALQRCFWVVLSITLKPENSKGISEINATKTGTGNGIYYTLGNRRLFF
jgi:hypothetical protein